MTNSSASRAICSAEMTFVLRSTVTFAAPEKRTRWRKILCDASLDRIVVRVRSTDNGVSVSVEDTGCGIPSTDLKRIFEPFYRVGQFMTASTRGLGLGLPLADRIVRWHGGEIRAASVERCGSTFTVLLPATPPGRPHRP